MPRFLPYSAEEITPAWLTEVLHEGGRLQDARVTGVDKETIGQGVGFLGELTRLNLTYDRSEAGAPLSLVSKLPTAFEQARQIANAFRFYEREARFYSELAPDVEVRVPRCYLSAFDVAADRYALLLEDIRDAEVGDQLAGCTREQAAVALREIARFHAAWWESPRLATLEWMPTITDPLYDHMEPLWRQSWDRFLELQADDYPREAITSIANRSVDAMDRTRRKLESRPQSIVHTDFRLDNMFFGEPGSATPFALIDWQLTIRGNPLLDVGYFLSQSLPVELRRQSEMDLLREYHADLVKGGVRGYSFEDCSEDYRFGVMIMFVIPVTAAANVDVSDVRAVPLLRALAERCTAAILDLRADETLPA